MKLSELIKEIEEIEGNPYYEWAKTKSGIEVVVTSNISIGAVQNFYTRLLSIRCKECDISIVITNHSIKDTIYNAREYLVKRGFIDDLQESPQELMQKAHEVVEEAKKHDVVNHPSHYTQGKVECIDALESATINKQGIEAVCVANVIKYLWRYESKNGLEDVKKAKWYLDRLIKELEK